MGAAEDANDALVRDFLAAWERRDTGFIVAQLGDDPVYHAVPLDPIVGREAVCRWVESFADVAPGHLEIHHQVASSTTVMNERTDRITIRGVPVVLPICAVFEIGDGRISAWREYFDLSTVTRAIAAAGDGS